jgi:predicted O-methyltransferase YrrM
MASNPVIHYMSPEDQAAGQLTGVWSTEESCYRFLAERCRPGSRTLETGSGISTILFAAWGAEHRCITPGQEEAEAVVAYCHGHGIDTSTVTFDVAPSDQALTRLPRDGQPLDIVLIDGCHGFPAPMIDWYFGAGLLGAGGVVVIDDLHLPAVRVLDQFLRADHRWHRVAGTPKWVAYERTTGEPLAEDWFHQPFYHLPDEPLSLRARVEAPARRVLRPVKRAVMRRLDARR